MRYQSSVSRVQSHLLVAACLPAVVTFAAVALAVDLKPTHPELGTTFVPSDVDWSRPVYRSSFDAASATADWKLEGGQAASVVDGKFVLESNNEGVPAENKNHLVCWLTKEMPADFLLEFSVRPRDRRDGLNIIFFNARGVGEQAIFDPALAPRTGDFKQYHSGDLKNYHISYWASSLEKGPRGDANVRKNPGQALVAVGNDLVTPAPAEVFQKIRLYKRGGKIRLMVDDVVSVAYDDDGQAQGSVWNHTGWIGLRQMGRTVRCEYDDLAVYALASSEQLADDDEADEIATSWPPAHMRNLPPDYLERLRASLEVGTERLDRLSLENSESRDSIGWVRYGLPSLLLGRRVDEINRFFESDKFIFTANPKFGFSLFTVSYMRLYGLLNDRSGTIRGLLTKRAQEHFEDEMWRVARVNGKLAEARRDVWDSEGSENHHLASKTSDLLAAQFLRQIPKFADQKYDDGSTLEEQYQARRDYFLRWLDERAKRGQFTEAASPSYQGDSINALFNLYDFAEDPVLRRKTEMYLDLTYAVIAEETLRTTRGGPKSRVKVGHEYDGGMSDRGYNVLFNAPGRTYEPLGDIRATSGYYPPPAVVQLAQDVSGRGTYAFATRWPGPVVAGLGKRRTDDPDGQLWLRLDRERTVLRKGFATPNYVLGSVALDATADEDASSGFRWQGVVFASDPLARIGFEVAPDNRKDWHGFNPFFTVQDRNLFITQQWGPIPPNPSTSRPAYLKVYFSPTLDDVQESGDWIFVRDGEAFAAVKVAVGGYAWTPAWRHADDLTEAAKAFITLDAQDAPVILYVCDAADYDGDFGKFQAVLKSQPIEHSDGALRFGPIAFHGATNDGRIDGRLVDLTPVRGYDSPFIRSDWNSGRFYLRKGDETVTLDFRDPQNPTKGVGVPVTADFPPGAGTVPPIVFGR